MSIMHDQRLEFRMANEFLEDTGVAVPPYGDSNPYGLHSPWLIHQRLQARFEVVGGLTV